MRRRHAKLQSALLTALRSKNAWILKELVQEALPQGTWSLLAHAAVSADRGSMVASRFQVNLTASNGILPGVIFGSVFSGLWALQREGVYMEASDVPCILLLYSREREREGDSSEGLIYLEFRGGRSGKASWRRGQLRIALDQNTRMVLLQSSLMAKLLRSVAQ